MFIARRCLEELTIISIELGLFHDLVRLELNTRCMKQQVQPCQES